MGANFTFDPTVDLSENKGPGLMAVTILMPSLSTLIVLTRLYIRIYVVRSCGRDDYLILGAALTAILSAGFTITSIFWGIGKHVLTLDHVSIREAMKWEWAATPPATISFYFSKLSVAYFLLRLVPHRRTAVFIYIIIGILTFAVIYVSIMNTGHCVPLQKIWDYHARGTCWPEEIVISGPYVSNAVGIFTDIVLVLLPISLLWKVSLDIRPKIAVMFILGLGVFTAICSVVKAYYISQLTKGRDPTYNPVELIRWTIIELNVGIIAASLPCLRPLFKCLNRSAREVYTRRSERRRHYAEGSGEMNFTPDSNTALRSPLPHYIKLNNESRDFGQITPYDRSPMEFEGRDHELGLLEAGYNASPVRSTSRSPYEMAMRETLTKPEPLFHVGQHIRSISKGSMVRLSPTREAIVLSDETDLAFLEEQRRWQIAKARRKEHVGYPEMDEVDGLRGGQENVF